jgi:hypothetical protein
MQHEQDPAQHHAVIQPLTPRIPAPPLDLGQQRFDPLPKTVGHDPRRILTLPHADDQPTGTHPYSKIILLGVLGEQATAWQQLCERWGLAPAEEPTTPRMPPDGWK